MGSLFPNYGKQVYQRQTRFLKPHENKFLFLNDLASSYSDVNQLQELEIMHTNLPALLRYEDKNSMRYSIETRLPFIDYQTLEHAMSITVEDKIKNGWSKYVLREVLQKHLPKELVWRKNKLGFNAPDNVWLDAISSDMEKEIKESKILDAICHRDMLLDQFSTMSNKHKWRLFNIAVWERMYGVVFD